MRNYPEAGCGDDHSPIVGHTFQRATMHVTKQSGMSMLQNRCLQPNLDLFRITTLERAKRMRGLPGPCDTFLKSQNLFYLAVL